MEKEKYFIIKDAKLLERFEREIVRKVKADFYKNLRIVCEMHRIALKLGVFKNDPLDGIDIDIAIAKAINSVGKTP